MYTKYLNRLTTPTLGRGGYASINKNHENILLKNITEIRLDSLYPRLLDSFHTNGILDKFNIEVPSKIINNLKTYLYSDLSESDRKEYKVIINSIYISSLRKSTHLLFELYRQYMGFFYDEIIRDNPISWVHIDTDTIHILGDVSLNMSGIKCNILEHDYIMFLGEKKFISNSVGKFTNKGFRDSDPKLHILIDEIKRGIREDKLNNILD